MEKKVIEESREEPKSIGSWLRAIYEEVGYIEELIYGNQPQEATDKVRAIPNGLQELTCGHIECLNQLHGRLFGIKEAIADIVQSQ